MRPTDIDRQSDSVIDTVAIGVPVEAGRRNLIRAVGCPGSIEHHRGTDIDCRKILSVADDRFENRRQIHHDGGRHDTGSSATAGGASTVVDDEIEIGPFVFLCHRPDEIPLRRDQQHVCLVDSCSSRSARLIEIELSLSHQKDIGMSFHRGCEEIDLSASIQSEGAGENRVLTDIESHDGVDDSEGR